MSDIDTIVVLDTETTGMAPQEGDALLEIAGVVLGLADDRETDEGWCYNHHFSWMIEHVGEIPPTARAVHHISPDMVAPGAPNVTARDEAVGQMLQAESPHIFYAAHNSPFDMGFLPELTRPWIDTLQCARHIWPDAPGYGNQVLRYWLGLEPDPALLEGLAPHRALYDTAVTAELLRTMLRDHSAEELVRLSTTPLLLVTCNFKKYRGTPWSEVPRDYLRWMVRENVGADDPNLQHTIRHYLES